MSSIFKLSNLSLYISPLLLASITKFRNSSFLLSIICCFSFSHCSLFSTLFSYRISITIMQVASAITESKRAAKNAFPSGLESIHPAKLCLSFSIGLHRLLWLFNFKFINLNCPRRIIVHHGKPESIHAL